MITNIQKVEAFVAAWNAGNLEDIVEAFTPDAVYHNIPMTPVEGKGNIAEAVERLLDGMSGIDWRILAIAQASDGAVLTERVDNFLMNGRQVSVPVMGVFQFRDGLIHRWADYFDLQGYRQQLAGR